MARVWNTSTPLCVKPFFFIIDFLCEHTDAWHSQTQELGLDYGLFPNESTSIWKSEKSIIFHQENCNLEPAHICDWFIGPRCIESGELAVLVNTHRLEPTPQLQLLKLEFSTWICVALPPLSLSCSGLLMLQLHCIKIIDHWFGRWVYRIFTVVYLMLLLFKLEGQGPPGVLCTWYFGAETIYFLMKSSIVFLLMSGFAIPCQIISE